MKGRRTEVDPDERADFLARLEYGLNPLIDCYGTHTQRAPEVGNTTPVCENGNGPGGAGNTTRSLTHPPASPGRGLDTW